MNHRLPNGRWQIADVDREKVEELVKGTNLSPLMAQVLLQRSIKNTAAASIYIEPEAQNLPSPLLEFPSLSKAVDLLVETINQGESIAICGDYDADGMTSTALLMRALKHLGAEVDYAIPSRMKDGYGINQRIVEEFAESGVALILTVDNGISAYDAIDLAVELGMSVIVTDHHEPPEQLPPADVILNPKLINPSSPYRSLAGVGVAYILAIATAQHLGKLQGLTVSLLELFTLGTIADLAPLVGVNRRWLKRGLKLLPKSQSVGIQALMQVAGVSEAQKQLQPDDIGFRLGPRINAVGRLADPQIVIELLTTEDGGIALERAMQCEQINQKRQELCEEIEQEAIAKIETDKINWQQERVLVLAESNWHHGVIGIVASRLVERYGVPVFLMTLEESGHLRGSARGIPEFHVFQALEFCQDLLGKFGGHQAAGGFSLLASNFTAFAKQLSIFAHQCLAPEHLKPLVKIDAIANFSQLDFNLYQQINSLQPWGIGNDFPIFSTANVRLVEQKVVGKNHLQLTFFQEEENLHMKAIAWRWGCYFPLPPRLDIAYKLQEKYWNGDRSLQLELIAVRLPNTDGVRFFNYQNRFYTCSQRSSEELQIINERGKILTIKNRNIGFLNNNQIDITLPHYVNLIQTALEALKQ